MRETALLPYFRERDQRVASLIERYGDLTAPQVQHPFEALTGAIVSQQLSSKAAATIFERFKALVNCRLEPESILALADYEFTSVGISRQKQGYLRALAEHFTKHPVDRKWEKMSDAEIISELTTVKGIGVWTVQMFLIFQLLRPDVFPIDDLGIRQGMIHLYRVEGTPREQRKELVNIAELWRPHRTVACRYIWRYYGDL